MYRFSCKWSRPWYTDARSSEIGTDRKSAIADGSTKRKVRFTTMANVTDKTASDMAATESDDDDDVDDDDAESTVKTREQIKSSTLPPNQRVQTMFACPAGLRALAEAMAEEKDIGLGTVIREAVAAYFDYTLPPTERRKRASKYANDAEREAAQKAKNKERNDTIKKLLALYNAGKLGDINLDADEDEDEDDDE